MDDATTGAGGSLATPLTPQERAVLPDTDRELMEQGATEILGGLDAEYQEEEHKARSEVDDTGVARNMRLRYGDSLKDISVRAEADIRDIKADPRMSDVGKAEAERARIAERDARVEDLKASLIEDGLELSTRLFPAKSAPVVEANRLERMESTAWAAYPHLTPKHRVERGMDALRRARGGDNHALAEIERVYLPWAERGASAPEHYAREWAPVNATLAEAMKKVLDIRLGRAAHRYATQLAQGSLASFKFAANTARKHGWASPIEDAISTHFDFGGEQ